MSCFSLSRSVVFVILALLQVVLLGQSVATTKPTQKAAAKSANVATKKLPNSVAKKVATQPSKTALKQSSNKSASSKFASKSVPSKTLAANIRVKSGSKLSRSKVVSKSANSKAKSMRLARAAAAPAEPPRVSLGQAIGLHAVEDPLELRSSVALAFNPRTNRILFEKNSQAVLPIASITKLMTAMVVVDAQQSLKESLEINAADVDLEKNSRSRLRTGSQLSRAEMLQLALMSSENRAANALARYYPGGVDAFVAAMNRKAKSLQMDDTLFFDATGLSSRNMSNARDLVSMVKAAGEYPIIRQYTTASELTVDTGFRMISFKNTNRLIDNPDWEISLSKTGYISEAGNCLVMQTRVNEQPIVLILLDAVGKLSRFADAQRLRNYLEGNARVVKALVKPLSKSNKAS